MRPLTKKGADKKAHILWREKGFEKSLGRCVICGTKATQPHHYIGKKNKSTKYYLPNCCPLCFTHHTGGNLSAHNNPEWFRKEMLRIRGEEWLKDLMRQSRKIVKWDLAYILRQIEELDNA